MPIGLAVLKAGVERGHSEIAAEALARVRDEIGPVASFKSVRIVNALPKTRSGKILRGAIRKNGGRRRAGACRPPSRTRRCSTTSTRC